MRDTYLEIDLKAVAENINFTIPIKKLLIVEHAKKNISWSFFSNALNF